MTDAQRAETVMKDLTNGLVLQIQGLIDDKVSLMMLEDPELVGTLALGAAAYCMSLSAATYLPQLRGNPRMVIAALSPADRIALALLAARASEGEAPVAKVRADLAALRRMGRL